MTVLYVYGTLRSGREDALTTVRGRLLDLGGFPGIILSGEDEKMVDVIVERIETDKDLSIFDMYESYYPSAEADSLYIRREYLDGWIYEYNSRRVGEDIPSGDWIKHCSLQGKDKLYGRFSL